MISNSYRSGPELILRAVNIEHGCDFDEKSPPRPSSDTHEFSDILLDTPNGDILGLKKKFEALLVATERLRMRRRDDVYRANLRKNLPSHGSFQSKTCLSEFSSSKGVILSMLWKIIVTSKYYDSTSIRSNRQCRVQCL